MDKVTLAIDSLSPYSTLFLVQLVLAALGSLFYTANGHGWQCWIKDVISAVTLGNVCMLLFVAGELRWIPTNQQWGAVFLVAFFAPMIVPAAKKSFPQIINLALKIRKNGAKNAVH